MGILNSKVKICPQYLVLVRAECSQGENAGSLRLYSLYSTSCSQLEHISLANEFSVTCTQMLKVVFFPNLRQWISIFRVRLSGLVGEISVSDIFSATLVLRSGSFILVTPSHITVQLMC